MRTYKYALCAAALAVACAPAFALDPPGKPAPSGPGKPSSAPKTQSASSAPKNQSAMTYIARALKPSKTEKDVDFGLFVLPGKAAWSIKAGLYFGLWYFFNVFYNVANKKALNALNLPWLQSLACVAVGIPYILFMWATGARSTPVISKALMPTVTQQSLLHAAGNVGGNVAFGAGSLGFAHVLKSCEPAFTAIFSGLITGKWDHPYVYGTLVPIMGGVAYASASEVSFNWLQFVAAMVSNVAFSLRAILGKISMDNAAVREISKLDGPNSFSTLQIGATLATIPLVALMETPAALWPPSHPNWAKAKKAGLDHSGDAITDHYLWKQLVLSGVMFQLYYECSYLALDSVAPVTHAIGNNLKRIVIVATSVIIFGQKMNTQTIIGSSVAIAGVLLYGQVKEAYKDVAKVAAKPAPPAGAQKKN